MTVASPHGEISRPAPDLRLLVERPSWPRVFFGNLRDLVLPRRLPPIELQSAPAPFWPDVFVTGRLPWSRFLQSGALSRLRIRATGWIHSLLRASAQVVAMPVFDHAQVIYYQPSEYLPPLDTRERGGCAAGQGGPRDFAASDHFASARSRQPFADHRHAAQRQAEARCCRCPISWRGPRRCWKKAAARDSACAVDSGGGHNADRAADGELGGELRRRMRPISRIAGIRPRCRIPWSLLRRR